MTFDALYTVRLFRALALTALLALVLSCATEAPRTFRFAAGTTDAERRLTEEAIDRWSVYTLPEQTPVIADDGEWLISFLASDDPLLPRTGAHAADGRTCRNEGKWCPRDLNVIVRRGEPDERTRIMLEHELGHTWRMDHVGGLERDGSTWGDLHSVMTEWGATGEISAADRAECVRVGACGSSP